MIGTTRLLAAGRARWVFGAAGGATPLTAGYYLQTPEQLSFNFPASRPLAEGTTVQLYYKLPISGTWIEAHPLLYVRAAEVTVGSPTTPVNACKGAIFDLVPGQTYDWRVIGTEPGVGTWEMVGQRATRALPPAAGATTVTATPASNLQALLSALTPGSVLQLSNGTYTLSTSLQFNAVGTEDAPIYVRGESRDGVILSRANGLAVQFANGQHTVLENLTIQGSGADSGTSSSSVGVEFWGGDVQNGITIRDLKIAGVDKGVTGLRPRQALVYNTELIGNNTWAKAYEDNGGQPNLTWNDDGMLLAGEGNCCWNCTLTGFGDATSSGHAGGGGRANYFYRLDIPMTGDDAHEADYTDGPVAFYDSRVGNCGAFFSADPVWGGPAFAFRNAVANSIRGPLKLNDANYGLLVYYNTVVRTPGTHGFGIYQSGSSGAFFQTALSHRGNLYSLRGSPTEVLRFDSDVQRVDWTHNGYTLDGSYDWSASGGGVTASLAAARAALPSRTPLFGSSQRHVGDIIVSSSNPWTETVTLGTDYTTEFTAAPRYELLPGSNAKNAGVAIPGITDGYTGAAPDLGCRIAGRAAPVYGAPSLALPSWVPAPGDVGVLTQANGGLANRFGDMIVPAYGSRFYLRKIYTDYSGTFPNPWWGTHGSIIFFGGGHAATNENMLAQLEFGPTTCTFRRLIDPSDIAAGNQSVNLLGVIPNTNGGVDSRYDPLWAEWTVDNKPVSPHSYASGDVIGPADGGAAYGSFVRVFTGAGGFSGFIQGEAAHKVDFSTLTGHADGGTPAYAWNRIAAIAPTQTGSAPMFSIKVPGQRKIAYYDRATRPAQKLFDFSASLASGTYQPGSGSSLVPDSPSIEGAIGFAVPERNLMIHADRGPTGNLRMRLSDATAASPGWSNTPATLSQNLALPDGWNCACWAKDVNGTGAIIVAGVTGDTTGYYEITIPAGTSLSAILAGTFTVTRRAWNNGATFVPGINYGFKAFSYSPKVKAIVYPKSFTDSATGQDEIYVLRLFGT